MSPLPPTPGAGNAPPNLRPGVSSERQQYDVSSAEDRNRTNSPQPSEGVDHEKQFKDLGKEPPEMSLLQSTYIEPQ